MEHSFYNDSLYNYLVIPAKETENYQYRMLAVNRIAGLLPCNIRTIDGKTYLYYDITSRQSLEEICKRPLPADKVKKLLYAVVNAGTSLSDYLLDDNKLLLSSEFIFYDYETDDFMFMYYPDETEGTSAKDLFEYLSEHVDPAEKRTMYILFRLCDLASMKNFILKKEFLEKEYEKDRHSMGEADYGISYGRINYGGADELADERKNDRMVDYGSGRSDDRTGSRVSGSDDDSANDHVNDRFSDRFSNRWNNRAKDHVKDRQEAGTDMEEGDSKLPYKIDGLADKKKGRKPAGQRENRLLRILGTAIIFLILAVTAEWAATNFEMPAEYRKVMLIMVIVFLSLAILTALIGTILTFFNGRKELKEEEKRIETQKKNEMTDAIEYQTEDSF